MSITNLIRREIERFNKTQPKEMVGLIDAWDPDEHAAKVKSLTEVDDDGNPVITGWLRVRTNSAGGSSLCIGPKIGDQCTYSHHEGDPEGGIITGFLHNDTDRPPPVAAGEFLFQQPDGGSIHVDAAGVATIKGKGGSTTVHDASGNITHTDGAGGVVYQAGGKVYLGSKTASTPVLLQGGGASTKIFGV